jgi:hypothetical protein
MSGVLRDLFSEANAALWCADITRDKKTATTLAEDPVPRGLRPFAVSGIVDQYGLTVARKRPSDFQANAS